jgi:hypothetical protein
MSVLLCDADESASVLVKAAISYLDSREPSAIQISLDPQTKISDLEDRVRSQLKGQIMRDRLTDPNPSSEDIGPKNDVSVTLDDPQLLVVNGKSSYDPQSGRGLRISACVLFSICI